MSVRCYRYQIDWEKISRPAQRATALRRKLENKRDHKGKTLTRPERDRLSEAKRQENLLGRKMLEVKHKAARAGCEGAWDWAPQRPPARQGAGLKVRRMHRQDLTAREHCEFVCRPHADKALALSEAGGAAEKKVQFYANRYWHCIRDCYGTKLPRKRREWRK